MGFEGLLCVDRVAMGGGLALLWRDSDAATLMSYSNNYIDITVTLPGETPWRLTCFYGYPERSRRQHTWDLLRELKSRSNLPWIVIGDFNDIASHAKKRGSVNHLDNLIRGFNEVLQDCELFDLDPQCREVVETSWFQTLGGDFQYRLNSCSQALWKWGSEHFRKFGKKVQQLREKLEALRNCSCMRDVEQYHNVERELSTLLAQEELYWRQRSKQLWLKEGDQNTKYFHQFASQRRRSNQLRRLKRTSGQWVEGTDMHAEIMSYYNFIFQKSGCNPELLHRIPGRVTHEMNTALLRPIEPEEVKNAVFSMAPDKAPGPDGMTPAFYQSFWSVVGSDLINFVTSCFANCVFPPGANDINVVLIPKKNIPERVTDLRPIALCNVAYKVIAKVLANRMKDYLDTIISPPQSAFIPDRLITDNIIVAGEVGHFLKRKRVGNMGWAALKLDMAKAYDRMEWDFLKGMLSALGFAREWVDLIMLCVSTVRYEILVNGQPVGAVTPTRGIRQGDPLSPYLFIICAEGLSMLLQQQEARGLMHGVRVARGAPTVWHLFFADDSLLFFRADTNEAQEVKRCLDLYCASSGQLVNYDKSSITFSVNTVPVMCTQVAGIFGVQQTADFGRYLGFPSFIGRNKKAIFRYVEQRMRDRINSWHKRFLSKSGKEVLLKSVAQSMPIFTMSVFLLPYGICESIERMMNRYWWSKGTSNSRGMHWASWTRLAAPKSIGGMGFKRIHEFNIALLAKQGWRLLVKPDYLVSKLLKARYYPSASFLDATLGHNPSYIWRSILAGQVVLRDGVARRIGDGKDTLVWDCPWLANSVDPYIRTACMNELRETHVSNLLDTDGTWDLELLHDIFYEQDIPRIISTPISLTHRDMWYWKGDLRGIYSVRHGYRLLTNGLFADYETMDFKEWNKLWRLKTPPKVRNLLWRGLRNMLPVRENLRMKGMAVSSICPLCCVVPETINHLFWDCIIADQLWCSFGIMKGLSFVELVEKALHAHEERLPITMASCVWSIWTARNDLLWNGKSCEVAVLKRMANSLVDSWQQVYSNSSPSSLPLISQPASWNPPPPGMLKCNVDATILANAAGFGAVLRDHGGRFIAAYGGLLNCALDPYAAETMAVNEALTWRCRSLANDIGNVLVRHVKRSVNHVAHVLARATVSQSVLGVWEFSPPDCISNFFDDLI
ncbi:uncharacterized protein LOC116005747 [Ipomoea triloba]|uniref:uncharacterized protein LOC116005747 n=1 Tax=Ipomoea triloba TaxID=35885 RepID=UPI00125D17E2|nr:uncharacterized protein LOC116005747 [Ipomoea triloba]